MRRRNAMSPGLSGHYQDLGIPSLKRHASAYNRILSVGSARGKVRVLIWDSPCNAEASKIVRGGRSPARLPPWLAKNRTSKYTLPCKLSLLNNSKNKNKLKY